MILSLYFIDERFMNGLIKFALLLVKLINIHLTLNLFVWTRKLSKEIVQYGLLIENVQLFYSVKKELCMSFL